MCSLKLSFKEENKRANMRRENLKSRDEKKVESSTNYKRVVTIHGKRKSRMIYQYKDDDEDCEDEKNSHLILESLRGEGAAQTL